MEYHSTQLQRSDTDGAPCLELTEANPDSDPDNKRLLQKSNWQLTSQPFSIKQQLYSMNENALFADGFDAALVGIANRFAMPPVATYDISKIIQILMDKRNMSRDEAHNYFTCNILSKFLNESMPVFITMGG